MKDYKERERIEGEIAALSDKRTSETHHERKQKERPMPVLVNAGDVFTPEYIAQLRAKIADGPELEEEYVFDAEYERRKANELMAGIEAALAQYKAKRK